MKENLDESTARNRTESRATVERKKILKLCATRKLDAWRFSSSSDDCCWKHERQRWWRMYWLKINIYLKISTFIRNFFLYVFFYSRKVLSLVLVKRNFLLAIFQLLHRSSDSTSGDSIIKYTFVAIKISTVAKIDQVTTGSRTTQTIIQ